MAGRKRRRFFRSIFKLMVLVVLVIFGAQYVKENGIQINDPLGRLSTLWDVLQNKIAEQTESLAKDADVIGVPFEEVTVDPSSFMSDFYYSLLSEDEQTVYQELFQGLSEQQESIYVHCADSDRIGTICRYILNDQPQLFWFDGASSVYSYDTYSEVQPVYNCDAAERASKQDAIDAAAAEALSGISADSEGYQLVYYVYGYLVNLVDYQAGASDDQNIYSALVNHASVCAGYSRSMQYLLGLMGIDCIYVSGTTNEGSPHAWNLVKLNDQYYQVDVTFADPVFEQAEGEQLPSGALNAVSYDWICITDEEIYRNHIPDEGISYPICQDRSYDYYVMNQLYFEEYDEQELLDGLNNAIFGGASCYSCKFASMDLMNSTLWALEDHVLNSAAQNLAFVYGTTSVRYYYTENDTLYTITVYFDYE